MKLKDFPARFFNKEFMPWHQLSSKHPFLKRSAMFQVSSSVMLAINSSVMSKAI
jgi:hypothetical protein